MKFGFFFAVGDDVLKRSECLEAKRPSSNFEEKLYLFLRGPTRPSGVRSTRPSAPSSRTAVSARAAREREAAPELSSGRDGAAREGSARGRCARRSPSVGRAATRRRRPRRAFVGRGRLRGEGGLGVGAACG